MARSFDSLQRQYDNMSPDESMDDFSTCSSCKKVVNDDLMHDRDYCDDCWGGLPRCEKHGVIIGRDECEDCEGEE